MILCSAPPLTVFFAINWGTATGSPNSSGQLVNTDFEVASEQKLNVQSVIIPAGGREFRFEAIKPFGDVFDTQLISPAGTSLQVGAKTARMSLTVPQDNSYALSGYGAESSNPEYRDVQLFGRPSVTLTVLRQLVLFADGDERSADPTHRDGGRRVHLNDIAQGYAYNCGVQAALIALADKLAGFVETPATANSGLISRTLRADGETVFTVYLHLVDGTRVPVESVFYPDRGNNGGLFNGDFSLNGSPEMWHMLVEDAVEEFLGGWDQPTHFAGEAWKALTNKSVSRTTYHRSNASNDSVWIALTGPAATGKAIVVGTHKAAPDLVQNHAYYFQGIDPTTGDILLVNPSATKSPPIRFSKEDLANNIRHVEYLAL
jgi:hypothetical protein